MEHLSRQASRRLVIDSEAVHPNEGFQELKPEMRDKLQGFLPVRADSDLAFEHPAGFASNLNDERGGHLEIVRIVRQDTSKVMAVP